MIPRFVAVSLIAATSYMHDTQSFHISLKKVLSYLRKGRIERLKNVHVREESISGIGRIGRKILGCLSGIIDVRGRMCASRNREEAADAHSN